MLFGWMLMCDFAYMNQIMDSKQFVSVSREHSVPRQFIHLLGPLIPGQLALNDIDMGTTSLGFYRDWQCFWGTFMVSFMLCLAYASLKSKATRLSNDSLLNNLLFIVIYTGIYLVA